MRNLKLSDWANVAEIIASIVIVASLAYIGLELNQNTQALQQESYQSMNDYLLELSVTQATNEDLNRIIILSETAPADATAEEWSRFVHIAYAKFGLWEFAYLSSRDKSFSENAWLAIEPYYLTFVCMPGYAQFWQQNQDGFSEMFREYIRFEVLSACREN